MTEFGALIFPTDYAMHPVALAKAIEKCLGEQIPRFAPYLMKGLTIVGTAAMFLVGGGILAHGIPVVYELFELVLHLISKLPSIGSVLQSLSLCSSTGSWRLSLVDYWYL